MDGRRPQDLAHILSASSSTLNGWLVIDGGGNRPAFDLEVSSEADLCLLPFRASEEDLDTMATDLQRDCLADSLADERTSAARSQFYIDGLTQAFPNRVLTTPIPFVNSTSELLAASLASPSTPVRQLARKVFDTVEDWFTQQKGNEK